MLADVERIHSFKLLSDKLSSNPYRVEATAFGDLDYRLIKFLHVGEKEDVAFSLLLPKEALETLAVWLRHI